MNCSCPMNCARGAGQKKKKKPKTQTPWTQTPIQTETNCQNKNILSIK